MPDDPTPDELRIALARLLGWDAPPLSGDLAAWAARRPDGTPGAYLHLPDPAADLNAMAAAEAALRDRGLLTEYTDAVRDLHVGRDEPGSIADGLLLTAPAAVRALAAYRVLMAARSDAPPTPPAAP